MKAKLNLNTPNVTNMPVVSLTKPRVVFMTSPAYLIVRSLQIRTIFLKHPLYAVLALYPITCENGV